MKKRHKLIKWVSYAEIEKVQDLMDENPKKITDDDYLLMKEAPLDEQHWDTLIQGLVRNKYIICGDTHQNFAIPVFDDGYLLLSMRKWAEIMDEAAMLMYPTVYFKRNYSAICFYTGCTRAVKENLPISREI